MPRPDWRIANIIFNPLDYPICLEAPRRLKIPNWQPHIPFAMFLVAALKPDRIVELGTHYGDSYCAFCQAVQRLGLATRCYAVDTWRGDPHSGRYGPEVLIDLRAHHDPLYAEFSTLIQRTFDDAVALFEDGSIDLLHIDGNHTYEAVKHDFETWLPKMSNRGLLLLHDTAEFHGDFGVWKLWRDLSAHYPSFEFNHGSGLGVLGVGGEFPGAVEFLFRASPAEAITVQQYFRALGAQLWKGSEDTVVSLGKWSSEAKGQIDSIHKHLELTDVSLGKWSSEAKGQIDSIHKHLELTDERDATLADRLSSLEQSKERLSERLERHSRTTRANTEKIEELLAMRTDLAGPLEVVRALTDVQHRLGVPFTISGFVQKIRHLDLRLKQSRIRRPATGILDVDLSGAERHVPVPNFDAQYQIWLRQHRPSENSLRAMEGVASRLEFQPSFSILMPVYNPALRFLRLAIESVLAQAYARWELCIVDDGSTDPDVRRLLEEFSQVDSRVRLTISNRNLGIAASTNTALDMAHGEFVGFLDHDDELWPNALYECAKLLNRLPDVDMIYSDEDKITVDGRHYDAFFKPDWSPDLLMSTMYTSHFSVYRRTLVVELGKMRVEYSGSQDYDLALRVTEKTSRIEHIPTVLYSWRTAIGSAASDDGAKPAALAAARRALKDALARRGLEGSVQPGLRNGRWDVRYRIAGNPSACIIVPSGGNVKCLADEIPSFLSDLSYPNVEFLVVDNSDGDEIHRLVSSLQKDYASLRYLEFRQRPFNYSAIVNHAVRQVTADYIVIMNDDLTVCKPGWLEAMLEHAQRPEVGIVGPKLLYPDGSVQHAGVVVGLGGVAGHVYKRYPGAHPGPLAIMEVVRNVSAVTFACVMLRRAVYEEIGGLDEVHLPVSFNDVDFCLRVLQRGYRVVFTPQAVLYHHESATRAKLPGSFPGEIEFMREVWADVIRHDPFYNPNLTRTYEDGRVAAADT